jgi:predicted GIY-YIG superfamily endonuclease
MPFYVYLLRCSDQSYYTGHTDDMETRIAQHQLGLIPCYTKRRRPVTLLKAEEFSSREEALATEMQIIGWTRSKKEAWAAENFEVLKRLSKNRQKPN